MSDEPARRESAIAWELRTAWATQREVGLSLDRRPPVRGFVEYVASTDAFVLVWDGRGELHVPVGLILAVHHPHFAEPGWGAPVGSRSRRPVVYAPISGQLQLFPDKECSGDSLRLNGT